MDKKEQDLDKAEQELHDSQQREPVTRHAAGPSAPAELDPAPSYDDAVTATSHAPGVAPTISHPFNFPSEAPVPPYSPYQAEGSASAAGSSSSAQQQHPIAIPQERPDAASPFIQAYPPSLLSRGITPEAWRGFIDTLSGFLAATVSDRAVSHAGDVARHIGEHPKSYGRGLYNHSKSIGKNIASKAKKGNIIGAAFGAIGGAISLPIHAATGLIGTTLSLPASAVGALSQKPKTPHERALAYIVVANQDWLVDRGLQATLLSTQLVAQLSNSDTHALVNKEHKQQGLNADGILRALEGRFAPLQVAPDQPLELGEKTVWLVLLPVEREEKSEKS